MAERNEVQEVIFSTLVWAGWLVLRINGGAAVFDDGQGRGGRGKRFVRFVFWQIVGEALQTAGVSDLLAYKDGVLLAIECKAPGKAGNTSAAQERFLAAVERAGGVAIVADSPECIEPFLENVGF